MIGAGTYVPSVGKWQKDSEGTARVFSLNPTISWSSKFNIYSEQYFCPMIAFSYHLGLEDEYTKSTLFVLYDFGWRIRDELFLRYGLGTYITRIGGDGESASLNNGTGMQTFYAPEAAANSFQTTLNLGMEYYFHPSLSLQSELSYFNFLSEKQKSFAYLLQVNFSLF